MNFKQALDFIQQETGILLPDTMHKQTSRYLAEELIVHQLPLNAFFKLLRKNSEEYRDFIQHVTINETYFFREQKFFKMLYEKIFPTFATQKSVLPASRQVEKKLTFWSAACASGEEALSLLALAESYFHVRKKCFCIYASDINPNNIEVLKKGYYTAHSFRRDGMLFHHYLEGIGSYTNRSGYKKADWLLSAAFQQKLSVQTINLHKSDLQTIPDNLDLILLRNILIYMPPENKLAIVGRVVNKLAPGGYLLLSSSEVPLISHPDLELIEWDKVYVYKRKDALSSCQADRPELPAVSVSVSGLDTQQQQQQLDTGLLCRYSSLQMNNKLQTVDNTLLLNIVSQMLQLVNLIHSGQKDKAEEELHRLTAFMPPNELTYYFRAYLDIMYNNDRSALIHLREALSYNETFWVARFYLAKLLLPAYPRQARREIAHCLKDIVTYLESEDYAYEFLLEGFHAKYFSVICQKWLNKLNNEGLTDELES